MLSLLANDLASSADYASVSLLAQDIGGEAKVEVVTPESFGSRLFWPSLVSTELGHRLLFSGSRRLCQR